MTFRILTVHQPHAWAIVAGRKDVENRPWPFPKEPGTLIGIHAAARSFDHAGLPVPQPDQPADHDLARGLVIGLVRVTECHECPGGCSPWADPGVFHWVLADATMLPTPLAVRGQLGLFKPPPGIAHAVAEQLIQRARYAR
jgi:hypothetical protein